VSYRTVNIQWLPDSKTEWRTFTEARQEAARLWADLVELHFRIRRGLWQWPSKGRWQEWAKGRYPGLHSQSVQQLIADFCEAVEATRQLRKNGHDEANYPFKQPRYKDVIYTNQGARLKDGILTLPNGDSGRLHIRIPKGVRLPGRIMEVRLKYGQVQMVCEVTDKVVPPGPTIGVDLGVNSLIAATDGKTAIVISGREAKATIQWRNKHLASIQTRQSQCTKHSRRYKRLQRRKYKMLGKAQRRINDIIHKATRKVADAFPHAKCYVGKTFNDPASALADDKHSR